ncbi:MAG: MBL fold metallo-hydrolase [Bacilli bacterium]|nr:MBL fold metallo-hydrolase [Bacilli bacterium]
MMKFCVLGSGSSGNMTYIEAGNTKLVVDCGISLLDACKRAPHLDIKNVNAILITHEHNDHVKFLPTFAKKTKATIYINKKSFEALKPEIKDGLVGLKIAFIEGDSCYKIGDVDVCTCVMLHDSVNNYGYIIRYQDKQIGLFTDTGIFPTRYKHLLSSLDAFLIEANHNIELLQNCDRPYYVINRTLSTTGHISNKVCCDLLKEVLTEKVKYVILGHISKDCNNIDCINEEILDNFKNSSTKFIIAKRDTATEEVVL